MNTIRVGIVGCGKIADLHVVSILRNAGCEIVALCDGELLMARQLGERFLISKVFSNVGEMLEGCNLDVVHITTPPQSHFPLAKQCLEAQCHIYLEKPFTVTAAETEVLIQQANDSGLKITAGHNYQFTPEMLEMRRLAKAGFLGGKPVHLESHWGYSLEDTTYVGPLLGNREHWVRRLPGQLFHNLISHGIAKLAEFLDEDLVEIVARAHQSPRLQSLGGQEVMDELRVMMRDRSGTTAFFCFSTQIKPGLTRLRVCGPSQSMVADYVSGSLIRYKGRACKSYLTYLIPPLENAREHLKCFRRSLSSILRRRLYQDSGMQELVGRFYECIRSNGPPPIPYREIRLIARIMDEIFEQIYPPEPKGLCMRQEPSLK